MRFVRRFFVIAAFVVLAAMTVAADSQTPSFFTTSYNSAHWYGDPSIAVTDMGLVHPASGLVRLGGITASIRAYSYGQYVIGTTASGGLLDVSFSSGTWRYTGIEGTADGHVTAWW